MEKSQKIKLNLPTAVVLGCFILGGAFYMVQLEKQKSIGQQQAEDNIRQDLLLKQKECEYLSKGVMDKWNNVIGVTYDEELWKECIVTYTNTTTGEIETAPLRIMQTVK